MGLINEANARAPCLKLVFGTGILVDYPIDHVAASANSVHLERAILVAIG